MKIELVPIWGLHFPADHWKINQTVYMLKNLRLLQGHQFLHSSGSHYRWSCHLWSWCCYYYYCYYCYNHVEHVCHWFQSKILPESPYYQNCRKEKQEVKNKIKNAGATNNISERERLWQAKDLDSVIRTGNPFMLTVFVLSVWATVSLRKVNCIK